MTCSASLKQSPTKVKLFPLPHTQHFFPHAVRLDAPSTFSHSFLDQSIFSLVLASIAQMWLIQSDPPQSKRERGERKSKANSDHSTYEDKMHCRNFHSLFNFTPFVSCSPHYEDKTKTHPPTDYLPYFRAHLLSFTIDEGLRTQ